MSRVSRQFRLFLMLGLVLLLSSALASFPRHSLAQTEQTCVQPPSGLVGWWPGDGDAQDLVGPHPGAPQGGAAFTPGLVDQAFSFDGLNDSIDVGDVDLPSSFTIEAWIRPNTVASQSNIIAKDDGEGSRSYFFAIEPGGTLIGSVQSAAYFTQYRTSNVSVTAGVWQHIAMTYDGDAPAGQKMAFFVNGTRLPVSVIGSYDAGGTPLNYSLSAKIGIFGDGVSQPFNGVIDETSIYNRVLSDQEIQAIFNAGSAGKCKPPTSGQTCIQPPAGIVSWWPGDGNAKDIVGQNDGTLQGGATFGPGMVQQAFSFNGTNGNVRVADNPSLKMSATGFSIEAWFNANSTSQGQYIVAKGISDDQEEYVLLIQEDGAGSIYWDYGGTQAYVMTSPGLIQPHQWYHVVVVYDASSAPRGKIYLNGIAQSNWRVGSDQSHIVSTGSDVYVGSANLTQPYYQNNGRRSSFDGVIDEVTLYNRVLSGSEVQGLFTAGRAGKCKPDTTAPAVSVSFPVPNGQNGWFVTAQVVGTVIADDTTTGGNTITAITCTGATVGSITGLGTPSARAALTVAAEGINNVSCTASDGAGNTGAATGSDNAAIIQIDMTAPTVSFAAPTNGVLYAVSQVVPASYTCQDSTGSGIASCNGSVAAGTNLDTSAVGAKSVSVTATDQAGNQTIRTVSYQVVTTFSMGPQAMEGDLKVSAGATLGVGYDFTMPGSHPTANVTFVGAQVTFVYTCVGTSGSGSFTVPIADQTDADPLNSSAWYPSGNQHDPSVFQGSYTIPASLCGSGLVRLNQGGTFSSGIGSTAPGSKVNVRWHYSANGSAGGWSGTMSIVPN